MRQGKLSELIHLSKLHPNLQKCTVEVHFEDVIDLVRGWESWRDAVDSRANELAIGIVLVETTHTLA